MTGRLRAFAFALFATFLIVLTVAAVQIVDNPPVWEASSAWAQGSNPTPTTVILTQATVTTAPTVTSAPTSGPTVTPVPTNTPGPATVTPIPTATITPVFVPPATVVSAIQTLQPIGRPGLPAPGTGDRLPTTGGTELPMLWALLSSGGLGVVLLVLGRLFRR
ncbi:MAG: hypothetical protein U0822_01125 [Anaerolineae bacterium]